MQMESDYFRTNLHYKHALQISYIRKRDARYKYR